MYYLGLDDNDLFMVYGSVPNQPEDKVAFGLPHNPPEGMVFTAFETPESALYPAYFLQAELRDPKTGKPYEICLIDQYTFDVLKDPNREYDESKVFFKTLGKGKQSELRA